MCVDASNCGGHCSECKADSALRTECWGGTKGCTRTDKHALDACALTPPRPEVPQTPADAIYVDPFESDL